MSAKLILKLAAPAALLTLTACATGLPTQVSRFQAMPAPQGQTFVIVPADPANRGGLEFAQYADQVRSHMVAQGYQPASSERGASLTVTLDYGVDNGREKVESFPSAGYGGWGSPFYPRYWARSRYPYYYGWNDPFFFGNDYDVRSYTIFTSFLDMDIKRTADGQNVFEGTAKARSRTDQLQYLVPNLVQAMFTGFPGNSGETVRITVPPPDRRVDR